MELKENQKYRGNPVKKKLKSGKQKNFPRHSICEKNFTFQNTCRIPNTLDVEIPLCKAGYIAKTNNKIQI